MPDLDVRGFQGGLTDDEDTQNPAEFVRGDNLDIEFPSKDLVSRGGSVVHNDVTPRITDQRVGGLINYNFDDLLLAVSEAKIFQDLGALGILELQGPAGRAFPGVSSDMIPSHAELNRQLFIASDDSPGDGVPPVKIYKDINGNLKLVTAGLPKFATALLRQEATVQVDMAQLASDIRAKMLAHFANTAVAHSIYAPPGQALVGLTAAADVTAAAAITLPALAFGDSLATAISVLKELTRAYQFHYSDAVKPKALRAHHVNILDHPGVPNVPLLKTTDATTFLEVAVALNDIRTKFNWHVRSFKGHYDPTFTLPQGTEVVVQHVTAAAIANVETGPIFSDLDYSSAITFANLIKSHFNAHLADNVDTGSHSLLTTLNINIGSVTDSADTENQVYLPDATDLDSLLEMTAWLYGAYTDHQGDAAFPVIVLTGSNYSANPNKRLIDTLVSATPTDPLGQVSNIEVGMNVAQRNTGGGNTFPAGERVVTITPPAAITVSADNNSDGGNPGTSSFDVTKRKYHTLEGGLATDIAKGNLDVLFDSSGNQLNGSSMAASLALALDALIDIATKFNLHDSNYGVVGAAAPAPHVGIGGHKIQAIDFPVNFGSFSYIYAFVWSYEYTTSDGSKIKNISTPLLKTKLAAQSIEGIPSNITGLPVLANDATSNYDVANVKLEIYRTQNAQTILRLVTSVQNGTVNVIENMSDLEIPFQEALYTTGGVVDNDPPPIAKVVHEHLGFGFYGNLKVKKDDGTFEYLPNAIAQSIPENLDAVPGSFLTLLPGPNVGISSTPRETIAWTKNGTFRLEGTFDERGQGGTIAVPISSKVGLISGVSPVQIDDAVVFAGSDGFYLCDGYKLIPLSHRFRETYLSLVAAAAQGRRITGTYDVTNKRVLWACSTDGDENDSLFVLHMQFGIDEMGGKFSTRSGGGSFRPSAIAMFNGQLIRGDSRGYILHHNDDDSDPFIDPNVDPADWQVQPIVWDYKSPSFDFGTKKYRKFVNKIGTFMENVGKMTAQIFRINDHGKSIKELTKLERSGVTLGAFSEKRRMRAGSLRCMTCQIQITNRDVGSPDEKARLMAYSLAWIPLGDSVSDADDDAAEVAGA